MTLSALTHQLGEFLAAGLGGNQPDDSPRFVERRAYTRKSVHFEGTFDLDGRRIPMRGIELHRAGARIITEQPLPTGAVVFFFNKSHGLIGWATIRWGAWHGQKFHAGLEFRHPLMRAEAGNWQFSCVLSKSPVETAAQA